MNIWATDAQQTPTEQTTVKYFRGRTRRKAKQLPPQTQNRRPACKNDAEIHASSEAKVYIRNVRGN